MSTHERSATARDTKAVTRDRLKLEATWVLNARTELFAGGNVPNTRLRYIVAIWIKGNLNQTVSIQLERESYDAVFSDVFSRIPVAPADFRQIPEGSYDLEDSVLTLSEGESFHGTTHVTGLSLNVTVAYWDNDV